MAKTNHLRALAAATGMLVAVGMLMLIMLVVEARTAEATFPGKNGKIAYRCHAGKDYEICTIKPDGGGRVQLTNNATPDSEPSYSPSGKKIAYSGSDGQDHEIYTIDAGGGGKVPLTDNGTNDHGPSYSPSGRRIAYYSGAEPTREIYTITPDGGVGYKLPTTIGTTWSLPGAVSSNSPLRPLERGDVEEIGGLCERACLTGSAP